MPSRNILDTICTMAEVDSLLRVIDILGDSLYRTEERSWEKVVQSQMGSEWTGFFDLPPQLRKAYLDSLQNQLHSLKVLRLRVAVDLPVASLRRICAWGRQNISPDVVLDMEIDPAIVAGAEISWAGKYIDLSHRTELDKLLDKYGRL